MLWVPDLEVQELDHLALVLFFVGLAQVELGQQEPLLGIQQVRGAELFEDLDGLATPAGSKGEYGGLEPLVLDAVGVVFQVLFDQPERLILAGRPALVQEQREADPVDPGFVARGAIRDLIDLVQVRIDLIEAVLAESHTGGDLERDRIGGFAFVVEGLADQLLGPLEVPERHPALSQSQGGPIGGQGLSRSLDGGFGLIDLLGLDQVLHVGQPRVRHSRPQLHGSSEFFACLVTPSGGDVKSAEREMVGGVRRSLGEDLASQRDPLVEILLADRVDGLAERDLIQAEQNDRRRQHEQDGRYPELEHNLDPVVWHFMCRSNR